MTTVGLALTCLAYMAALSIANRIRRPWANTTLIAALIVVAVLILTGFDLAEYRSSSGWLSTLLTPATICLAIPLNRHIDRFLKQAPAILVGLLSGILTGLGGVWILAKTFALDRSLMISLLPKSVTTALAMPFSQMAGGNVTLTVAAVIITGILGAILAEPLTRWFKISDPVAKGIAIGTASHVIGTSKAVELGETEAAASSLALILAGLSTLMILALILHYL